MNLPEELLALLRAKSTCYIATIMKDGSPQLTQVWVDTDGEHVVINSVETHVKVRNLRRDPRVAVTISDPEHPRRYFQVRGRAAITTDGRRRAHREAFPEVQRRPVPLVRRERPGACDHHDRSRQGQRNGRLSRSAGPRCHDGASHNET